MMPLWIGWIISAIALYARVQSQTGQTFQETPVYNVVKNSPVLSSSSRVCSKYCNSDGATCVEETCDSTCPWGEFGTGRKTFPLRRASPLTGCDGYHSSQGFSDRGTNYTFFNSSSTSNCVINDSVTTNGYFAVGFWIISEGITCTKSDCDVPVLKISDGQQELLKVLISMEGLHVVLKGGSTTHRIKADLSKWYHLAVQFTNYTISIVNNGELSSSTLPQSQKNDPTSRLTVTVGASTTDFTEGQFAMSDLMLFPKRWAEESC